MIKHVAFRMVFSSLSSTGQWNEQRTIDLKSIDRVIRCSHLRLQIEVRIFFLKELFKLRKSRSFDRLSGDRAFELKRRLVRRVHGQLNGKAILDMEVREDSLFTMLADAFAFQLIVDALRFKPNFNSFSGRGENVDVDVGTLPNMTGEGASDNLRSEVLQHSHQSQGFDAHLAKTIKS